MLEAPLPGEPFYRGSLRTLNKAPLCKGRWQPVGLTEGLYLAITPKPGFAALACIRYPQVHCVELGGAARPACQ